MPFRRVSRRRPGARGWPALCAALALLAAPSRATAQGAGSASLRGRVRDASGAVLPGATVTLANERTKALRTQASDDRGEYVFVALLPDRYRVRVELGGFAPWRSGEVHLSPGDSLHLDTTLTVGDRTEEVTVLSERQLVRTDTGARDNVITSDQIQTLSIVSRGALELLKVLPGVVSNQESLEAIGFNFGGANDLINYSVNGQRGTQMSPVLDGSKIVDFGSNGGVMANMNPEMVDEVKVQTSNYAAEYGSSTVQITAVTKGGSSSFHGSVYDYWRNWRLAANDRSNNYADVPRPKSDYNYPGLTLSGPLLVPGTGFNRNRDKLFFFVGLEHQHQRIDPGTRLGVVPTLAQREGDFGELLAGEGQNLGQPTAVTIPNGFPGAGEAAPGNNLRPYADPFGRGFMSLYPAPNHVDPDNRYNYAFNTPQPLDRWQLVSRLDWNVSEATHAYVRLALEKERLEWARGIWDCCSAFALPSNVVGDNKAWSVSANVTSVLSPTLTNEFVVSASQLKLDNDWEDPSKVRLSSWGLEGWRGIFDDPSGEVPMYGSWGQDLGTFGNLGAMPIYAHNDSLSLGDNLTKVTSTHTIKLGVFVERGRKQQNGGSAPQGQLGLAAPWTPGGTGNDYGDLLVGRVAQFFQDTGIPRGEWQFWNVEGFAQDSWKALRNLTVEAGLRVAWMPNNEERNGLGTRLEPSAYDPTQGAYLDGDLTRPNGVLVASRGQIPLGMTEDPSVAFMPRLNFAWDVRGTGDLVVRGGAGLFYNRVQGNYQYFVQNAPPNTLNTLASWWDVEGGLTYSSLPTLDPYSRPATSWVDSLDARSVHLPRTTTWSLAVAKRLPWRQSLELAYVGNRQDHLPNRTLSNYIVPGRLTGTVGNADLDNPFHRVALDASVAAQYRVFPAWSIGSWWYQFEATAEYHALQASLTRQAGRRVQYFLNYTFGKVLGTTGFGDYAVLDPLDPRNRSYGVALWDRTHIFNASYSYLAPDPIGPDGNVVLRGMLNGWQVSGLTRYASGAPFHLVLSGDIVQPEVQRAWWGTDAHQPGANDGNAGGVTPVFLGDPRLGSTGTGEKLLDIDRVGIPAFGESGPFQSPYYFRLPSRWNWDVSVFKTFGLGGRRRLQLRFGAFNLFNQAAPGNGLGDVDLALQTECNVRVDGVPDGAGGFVDGVCDPTQGFRFTDLTKENFGKIVTKRGHRVIQLAARFEF